MMDSFEECRSDGGSLATFKTDAEFSDMKIMRRLTQDDLRLGLVIWGWDSCYDQANCDNALKWHDMTDFDPTIFTGTQMASWNMDLGDGRCGHWDQDFMAFTDDCISQYKFVCQFDCNVVVDTTCPNGDTVPAGYTFHADGLFYKFHSTGQTMINAINRCAMEGAVMAFNSPLNAEQDYYSGHSLGSK